MQATGQNARSSSVTSKSRQAVEAPERRGADRVQTLPIVAHVEGKEATVVNMSNSGAQMISATRFKPNQRVRVYLPSESGLIRCHAVIAWAMFEIPRKGEAIYRLGIYFTDVDAELLNVYCQRHRLK